MSEQRKIAEVFVKVGKDGTVERTHQFAPWPTGPQIPGSPPRFVAGFAAPDDGGPAPLRHLTYDDPPGIGLTPDEYRAILANQVRECGTLELFTETVTRILVRDLVVAHGCRAEDAIPAVMAFAAKVYAEFSGTV